MSSTEHETPVVAPRHGKLARRHPVRSFIKWLSIGLSCVLVATLATGAITALQFSSDIETVDLGSVPPPGLGEYEGGFNVLLVGSDSREGQGELFGEADYGSGALNDVTMLVHVSSDHKSATIISLPRDLLVDFPACPETSTSNGAPPGRGVQFNSALGRGGLECVATVVEDLTGLEVPYAAMITFTGVINMSTAVGGVDICTTGPILDRYSGLDIPSAGTHSLEGVQALAFLRSRHGIGDGSDLSRIAAQQAFMSSLARKLQSEAVLTDVARLFQIAQVARDNMVMSSSLSDIGTMVSMAQVFANIPLETMQFVQFPTLPAGPRVIPNEAAAAEMFELIQNNQPLNLGDNSTGTGSELIETEAPVDTEETPVDPAAPVDPVDPATPEGSTPDDGTVVDPTESSDVPDPSVAPTPPPINGVSGQDASQESCIVPFGG
ncbi:LCP family protein [Humidisolicoccus flavus]|uniref:LCP family protein n=1 Tax=Humidisolicoccus flavus TaxID=3111414 RepID=UPI003244C1F6